MTQPREILKRIKGVENTQQITRAMKMVAASKLRKVLDRTIALRPYSDTITRLQDHLMEQVPDIAREHFRDVDKEKNIFVIFFTGDRGLCGSFNINLIKEFDKFVASKPDSNFKIFCFGRKGEAHVKKLVEEDSEKFEMIGFRDDLINDIKFPIAFEFAKTAKDACDIGNVDSAYVVFSTFENVLSQWAHTLRVWPPKIVEEPEGASIHHHLYLYDPNPEVLIDPILLRSLAVHIFQAMLESVSSEYSARMSAMENATHNADDIVETLTLEYNKSRQASITNEILDIVCGAEAMNASGK